jgi:YidC/Oxa1 family membrane protein insertase
LRPDQFTIQYNSHMAQFFTTVFYQPLYNGLIFLMDLLPWADAGVVVILFTIIVKLILFPLSIRSVKTQLKMKQIEPQLQELKTKYKDNREEQARKTLELYRANDIHPFAGFFLILIQLPILFALYKVFYATGLFVPDLSLLYSFVEAPSAINPNFLGILDISKSSIWLALIAAVSQYFQVKFSLPPPKPKTANSSFQDDLARSMSLQMRYILPAFIFFIAWKLAAALSLYWITSNLFMIAQELYIRRRYKKS